MARVNPIASALPSLESGALIKHHYLVSGRLDDAVSSGATVLYDGLTNDFKRTPVIIKIFPEDERDAAAREEKALVLAKGSNVVALVDTADIHLFRCLILEKGGRDLRKYVRELKPTGRLTMFKMRDLIAQVYTTALAICFILPLILLSSISWLMSGAACCLPSA